jgi:hypothetical protein
MIWSERWPMTPGKISIMLREAITDDFDDPPSSSHPEGVIRSYIPHLGHMPKTKSSTYGIAEEERSREWQEGERTYLR